MAITDITGEKIGRWTVLSHAGRSDKQGYPIWLCKCDCGTEKQVSICSLRRNSKSCGCLRNEKTRKMATKHGFTTDAKENGLSTEYNSWVQMKSRCNNPAHEMYKYYGGKGVKVCERWENSFEVFLQDMGHKPTLEHSIDRFPNKNGDYEPSNCRWATDIQQNGNRNSCVWIEYNGEKMIIADWARKFNVNYTTLDWHIKRKPFSEVYEYFMKKNVA